MRMSKVKIECHKSPRYPNNVYAKIYLDGEMVTNATLDYCIAKCHNMNLEIENAQDVLFWLHNNADFKAYK
jgi:hypothetical protein